MSARMQLDNLSPAPGSRRNKRRVGRGKGCTLGKTCGRGIKGQKARNTVPAGFEGGQMPLHRRVPKFGFTSWRKYNNNSVEIRLSDLNALGDVVDMNALREANLLNHNTRFAKIIANGEVSKKVTIKGIKVTKGAKAAIEAAGGSVEE